MTAPAEAQPMRVRSIRLFGLWCRSERNVMGDKTRGLYNKFAVTRTDGSSEPGGKHHGCEYFVLDLTHDKHAEAALRAYAASCAAEYPLLAANLLHKLDNDEAAAYAWTGGGGVQR